MSTLPMAVRPLDPLSTAMNMPLSLEGKAAILSSLWDLSVQPAELSRDSPRFATYFRYYEDQCRKFLHNCIQKQQLIRTKTHRDIVNLAQLLQLISPGSTLRKDDILAEPRSTIPIITLPASNELLSDTIDFVARLLLMIDIGPRRPGDRVINQLPIPWEAGTLQDLIASQFHDTEELAVPVRLERIFTAPNLELIGDIQIVWTDNLADHLRMSEDDTKVAIYGHAQFLKMNRNQHLFPPGLIEETLQTLALLLPRRDTKVSQWFQQQQKIKELRNRVDSEAASERRLKAAERQISKFVYWHDRLVILKQAFDESQPKNLRQWWNDRRNPVQWYNFWFAVALIVGLTVFFGVVSSVEGGIQVYKVYHPS